MVMVIVVVVIIINTIIYFFMLSMDFYNKKHSSLEVRNQFSVDYLEKWWKLKKGIGSLFPVLCFVVLLFLWTNIKQD